MTATREAGFAKIWARGAGFVPVCREFCLLVFAKKTLTTPFPPLRYSYHQCSYGADWLSQMPLEHE